MKLQIVKIPDPILRQKTVPVTAVTPELQKLASDMLETMRNANGIGLAAPQVNHAARLLVCGLEKTASESEHIPQTVLFNAKITSRSKATNKSSEGCLSIPTLTGVVERASAVTVKGLDFEGQPMTVAAQDLYARVLQHEIDHLDGILFTDRLEKYRVVFYGTSEFALPALEALLHHPQFDVVAVVTETDKPAGRGHKLTPSPVKQFAYAQKLSVLQPESLNVQAIDRSRAKSAERTLHKIAAFKPQFQIVAAYGKILPKRLLDIAGIANLNLHPSLLPKYRGATPIQSAIQNGETSTGTSIMMMVPEMDAGPILSMYKHKIEPKDTAGTLGARLARASAAQLIVTLEEILSEKAQYWEQPHNEASFTEKITGKMAHIDWSKSAEQIVNLIRAMSPKPGAWTTVDGRKIKILSAHLAAPHSTEVRPLSGQEKGGIEIDQVQLAGKSIVSFKDFSNGHPDLALSLQDLCNKV